MTTQPTNHHNHSLGVLLKVEQHLRKDPSSYLKQVERKLGNEHTLFVVKCLDGSPLLEDKELEVDFLLRIGYTEEILPGIGVYADRVHPTFIYTYMQLGSRPKELQDTFEKIRKYVTMQKDLNSEYDAKVLYRGQVKTETTFILRLWCDISLAKLLEQFMSATHIPGACTRPYISIICHNGSPARLEVGYE